MRLLISLGTSWPVVPEAFLHPEHHYTEVHVLTTGSERIDPGLASLRAWFAGTAPGVTLTITRVRGFTDLTCAADHEAFEEVLYRWFLAHRNGEGKNLWVCLSGGFKTMSAAVQQTAEIFGCDGMFHVLCADQPNDSEGIEAARAAGRIHWIELGARRGWAEFRRLDPGAYPLDRDGPWAAVSGEPALRNRVNESLRRTQFLAERWEHLEELPFRSLATFAEPDLDWLRQPLDPDRDREWIAALPKVELHCHLGGFATSGQDLEEVRRAAADPGRLPPLREIDLPSGWPMPAKPIGLPKYMSLGDNNGSVLLGDPGCLRRQVELLYAHLQRENVAYAEIRCSPGNYADPERGRSGWDVLAQLVGDFTRLQREAGLVAGGVAPRVNLLIIATRKDSGDYRTGISRHLALAATAAGHWTDPETCRVVGVDLAGYEDRETRAHYFREDFTPVHRAGLAVTVHAGENDDAEAIWSAIFDLNARRIGHALHLIHSPALLDAVAARGVGLEMCPYANQQIVGFALRAEDGRPAYPLANYLRRGIPVSVNTDNIGISGAGLTDNLLLAARLCPGLTRMDVLTLIQGSAATSFLTEPERLELRNLLGSRLLLAGRFA